jgi:hypothetical protein
MAKLPLGYRSRVHLDGRANEAIIEALTQMASRSDYIGTPETRDPADTIAGFSGQEEAIIGK